MYMLPKLKFINDPIHNINMRAVNILIFLAVLISLLFVFSNGVRAWGEVMHCSSLPKKAIETNELPFSGYNEYFVSGAWSEDWYTLYSLTSEEFLQYAQSRAFANALYNLASQSGDEKKEIWASGFPFSMGTDNVWGDWRIEEGISPGTREGWFKYTADVVAKCKLGATVPSSIIYYPDLIKQAYKEVSGESLSETEVEVAIDSLLLGTKMEYLSI